MFNKISYKIGGLLVFVIVSYICLITFVIQPKINTYLKNFEENSAKSELKKVASDIESKAKLSQSFSQQFLISQKRRIKDLVNFATIIIDEKYQKYQNKKQVLNESFSTISKIKFGNDFDYVYILNKDGVALLHPDKKLLNQDLRKLKDLDGKLFIDDLIKKTIKNGYSYKTYKWYKHNSTITSKKIVYAKYYKPLDLIIVAGVYVDDIINDEQLRKYSAMKNIKEYAKDIKIGENGYIFIFDKDFKYIYHPNRKYLGKTLKEVSLLNIGIDLTPIALKAYKESKKFSYNWNRIDDLSNYVYKKSGWIEYNDYFELYIVSSSYEDDFTSNAKDINNIIFNFSILIFSFLLIVGIYMINKLVKPIEELINNSNEVKKGNFGIRNQIKSSDEIGILSEQFNFMLDKIEYNIKNLELEVNSRTKELEYKIYHDNLTNVLNRNAFFRDIKNQDFATLILVDIKNFDDINELYGFDVGNELLKEIGKILTKFVKNTHYKLYKVYGDIFALLDTNIVFKIDKLEKLVNDLNSLFFDNKVVLKRYDLELDISISLGISVSNEYPLKAANIALRSAKRSDRNFYIYNNEMDPKEKIKESRYWEHKIKDAILENKIVPFYQAIFDRENNIVKYEALMRMDNTGENKEGENFILPSKFLEFAKKSKQYNEINLLLIKKVLKEVSSCDKQISINLSFKSIQNSSFVKELENLIDTIDNKYYKYIVFEILESEFVWDYRILENFIIKYKKMGIKIAIDDFGSGYSNFKHILNVMPDYLKIDGSLIQNIDKEKESYELVKYITKFAHAIGIKTVAEYVHSKEVYDLLYEIGIDEFQGFYLAIPKKEFNN